MRLQFVREGKDAPLMLIAGHDPVGLAALRDAARRLTVEIDERIVMEHLAGFSSLSGCSLVMTTGTKVKPGVTPVSRISFRWNRDPEGWAEVADLVEPFLHSLPGARNQFQYLENDGGINVVLSVDGSW